MARLVAGEKGWTDSGLNVINYISKRPGLPDGDEKIGKLYGIHRGGTLFLRTEASRVSAELKREAFAPYRAFSVGETPGVGMEDEQAAYAEHRGELDMVFSFDHLETPGHVRFDDYRYDLNFYKRHIADWMENYGDNCRTALFF
jgi:oligo-1,6-glucosidase